MSLHVKGAKDDSGKNRVSLVIGGFATAILEVSKVGTFGANKYTDNGWQEVPNGLSRYEDALLRHFMAYKSGEYFDPESKLPHLAHCAWNALAVLTLSLKERNNASKNRSGQHQSSGEANHNDGVGIPSIHSRRINDAPRLQPKWPVISGCPSEEELGSIPSIADVIRKECSRNEQQGKPFPIPNYFMQGTMGGCSVRGSSVFFDHGQDRAAQAVGQSSP